MDSDGSDDRPETFSGDKEEEFGGGHHRRRRKLRVLHTDARLVVVQKVAGVLMLYGRRAGAGRLWHYYAKTQGGVVIPLAHRHKACDARMGCPALMQGDRVYIPQYNSTYEATIYRKK